MSEAIEKLRREIDTLKAIIAGQESGLPPHLGVIVHSDNPTHIEDAVRAKLAPYGLSTVQEAERAGCSFSVVCLPYCEGRSVDKVDPVLADELRNAGKSSEVDPLQSEPEATDTAQRISNPQFPTAEAQADKALQTNESSGAGDQLPANFPKR